MFIGSPLDECHLRVAHDPETESPRWYAPCQDQRIMYLSIAGAAITAWTFFVMWAMSAEKASSTGACRRPTATWVLLPWVSQSIGVTLFRPCSERDEGLPLADLRERHRRHAHISFPSLGILTNQVKADLLPRSLTSSSTPPTSRENSVLQSAVLAARQASPR